MSTTLYLVRHAEVENPKGIEYMRLPGFGLSKHGQHQAKELYRVFSKTGLDRIYASPLKRTKETALIIANGNIPIRYLEGLLEANFKRWQGFKREDRPREQVEGYWHDPVKYSAILGESIADIQKRVVGSLSEIVDKNQGHKIAIVTHAAPLVTARLFFEKRPLADFSQISVRFGSVTTITLNDRLECTKVGYHEYVDQREGMEHL